MNQDDSETRETRETPQGESRAERPAKLKQKHTEVAAGNADADGRGGGSSGSKSLADLLKDLKEKRPDAAAAQVDNDIADLEKLIADAEAAEESYDQETFKKLSADENQLKGEKDTLKSSLEAALGAEVGEIKGIEAEQVKIVRDAEKAVEDAEADVKTKKEAAEKKSEELADAKAILDLWRKPGDSIAKRHKRAQTLIDEIKKLRNGPNRGEAYWKLALGCPEELSEDGCPEELSEQDFLHKVLDLPPPIVDPGQLESHIKAAWTAFKDARKESVKANVELENAEAVLKAEKTDYADKSKNLIKAIAKALAERDAASDAA